MRMYPQQCTEKLSGVEWVHDSDGPTSKVSFELDGLQDCWDGKTFGEKRFYGTVRFASASAMRDILRVGHLRLMLKGARELSLHVIEPAPNGDGPDDGLRYRVGSCRSEV